jgi:hypothetical protein
MFIDPAVNPTTALQRSAMFAAMIFGCVSLLRSEENF